MCANLALSKMISPSPPRALTPSSSVTTHLWHSLLCQLRDWQVADRCYPATLLTLWLFLSFYPRSAWSEQTPSYLVQTGRGNAASTVHSSFSSAWGVGEKNPLHCLNLGSVNRFSNHMLHLRVTWHRVNGDGLWNEKLDARFCPVPSEGFVFSHSNL